MLESAGMRIRGLTDAAKATLILEEAAAENEPYDLCVLDIQMPRCSGYDVARQIRSSDTISHLSLLAFSSSLERDATKCLEAGFDGFLPKPVNRQKLMAMIENLVAAPKQDLDKTPKKGIATQHSVREDSKFSTRILLAEDNPVNQRLAKMMLTKAGYQVDLANNGQEAVEKFIDAPEAFDLIFMDVQMPDMDGMEATKTIRDDGFEHIPIIAMTAHAMKGDREKCLQAGMDDYITKPIKRELVFEMIEKWVVKREAT
jgi:CheY-like chemotaxis protein